MLITPLAAADWKAKKVKAFSASWQQQPLKSEMTTSRMKSSLADCVTAGRHGIMIRDRREIVRKTNSSRTQRCRSGDSWFWIGKIFA